MKLLANLIDNEYPNNGYDHTRVIVRAFILNSNNDVLMHHLFCDDMFGHRDYLETPGGGVKDNEDLILALRREIKEETGLEVEVLSEIGEVDDFYNLINRKNKNYFYLCKMISIGEKALEEKEKVYIKSTKWYSLEELKQVYENTPKEPLARLVYNRERIPFNIIYNQLKK